MRTRFDESGPGPDDGRDVAATSFILVLERAIASARFVQAERVVLHMIREACGTTFADLVGDEGPTWPPGLGCRLDLFALARATGIEKREFFGARRELLAARVLIEEADGSLRVDDRIELWVHPATGRPRLTPKLVAFCRREAP